MMVNAKISNSQVLDPKQGIHPTPCQAPGTWKEKRRLWNDREKICKMLSLGYDITSAVMDPSMTGCNGPALTR